MGFTYVLTYKLEVAELMFWSQTIQFFWTDKIHLRESPSVCWCLPLLLILPWNAPIKLICWYQFCLACWFFVSYRNKSFILVLCYILFIPKTGLSFWNELTYRYTSENLSGTNFPAKHFSPKLKVKFWTKYGCWQEPSAHNTDPEEIILKSGVMSVV